MRHFILFLSTLYLTLPAKIKAKELDLSVFNYQQISFDGIRPTVYRNEDSALVARVSESSSILMKAFERIEKVSFVSIEWKSTGDLKIKNFEHQISKDGDDAKFRIGLILSGHAPVIPFFAPTWVKKTKDILKLPSDKMIYLVLGAEAGKRWKSPYSGSIESIALANTAMKDGWYKSEFKFEERKQLVGVWLFSDGDNTKSSFVTKVRKLEIRE